MPTPPLTRQDPTAQINPSVVPTGIPGALSNPSGGVTQPTQNPGEPARIMSGGGGAAQPPKIGFGSRLKSAVNYVINGVTPQTWFSPMQPLMPMAPPEVKGRVWDYPIAWNLNYMPRTWEPVSFERLNTLATVQPVLRTVIETRKDQVESLKWTFQPKVTADKRRKARREMKDPIARMSNFWEFPDHAHDWNQWIRGVLEQHFVYDAVAIFKRRQRNGEVWGLEQIDAADITVLMDADGKVPLPPSPAYQQVLKGIPAADYASFTSGDLIYAVKNFRPDHMYGYGPVEQIVAYVEMAIARVKEQLAFYTHGDVPRGVMEAPASLTQDQVTEVQTYWDSIFMGNIEERARLWWVPAGSKYTPFEKEILFDEFDEWLARVICYAFSVNPMPFIKQRSARGAQTSMQEMQAEGLQPTMRWIKRLVDRINRECFGVTDIEFAWEDDREFDPTKAATIDNLYVRAGIKAIDEVRDDIGYDPVGGAASEPMFATATGYVPIDSFEQQQAQQAMLMQQQHEQGMLASKGQPLGSPQNGMGGQGAAGIAGSGMKPPAATLRENNGASAKAPHPGKEDVQDGLQPTAARAPAMGKAWWNHQPDNTRDESAFVTGAQRGELDGIADGAESPSDYRKVTLGECGLLVRPVVNIHDLQAWGRANGIAVDDDLYVEIVNFVGGLFVPFELDDTHPLLIVDSGMRSLTYDDQGTWLIFESPMLQTRAVSLGGMGSSLLRIQLNSDTTKPEEDDELSEIERAVGDIIEPYSGLILLGPEAAIRDHDGLAKVTKEQIDNAASVAHGAPSLPQRDAGNYRMGHIKWQGLNISIENAKGSVREGRSGSWRSELAAHYGYIRGYVDADGEQIDVFIGPNPDSKTVWIMDQTDKDGKFDEHKCFIAFDTAHDALRAYVKSYADANHRHHNVGGIIGMDIPQFKHWLRHGDLTEPLVMPRKGWKDCDGEEVDGAHIFGHVLGAEEGGGLTKIKSPNPEVEAQKEKLRQAIAQLEHDLDLMHGDYTDHKFRAARNDKVRQLAELQRQLGEVYEQQLADDTKQQQTNERRYATVQNNRAQAVADKQAAAERRRQSKSTRVVIDGHEIELHKIDGGAQNSETPFVLGIDTDQNDSYDSFGPTVSREGSGTFAKSDDLEGGEWRTIDGSHVYIKDGSIVAGPAHLKGKDFADIHPSRVGEDNSSELSLARENLKNYEAAVHNAYTRAQRAKAEKDLARQRDKIRNLEEAEKKQAPKPEPKPEPKKAEPKPEPKSEPKPEPKSEPKPEPKSEPKKAPKTEPKTEPKPEPKSEPKTATPRPDAAGLDDQIKAAAGNKPPEGKEYIGQFSKQDREALRDYSVNTWSLANEALRSGKMDDTARGIVKNLDEAFKNPAAQLPEDIVVSRGFGLSTSRADRLMQDFKDGKQVMLRDKGFTSTTTNGPDKVDDYLDAEWNKSKTSVIIHALVPKGTRGINMRDVAAMPQENEVLLNRGGRFHVASMRNETLTTYDRAKGRTLYKHVLHVTARYEHG